MFEEESRNFVVKFFTRNSSRNRVVSLEETGGKRIGCVLITNFIELIWRGYRSTMTRTNSFVVARVTQGR